MFKFFIKNDPILLNQSSAKPSVSCLFELVSITHELYKSFDGPREIRGISLDMSKSFDKIWHDGVIFKLTQNGISRNLLKLLQENNT